MKYRYNVLQLPMCVLLWWHRQTIQLLSNEIPLLLTGTQITLGSSRSVLQGGNFLSVYNNVSIEGLNDGQPVQPNNFQFACRDHNQ